MRDFNSHTTLPPSAKGETLTPSPSPRTGEGSNPHPRYLSQRGEEGR